MFSQFLQKHLTKILDLDLLSNKCNSLYHTINTDDLIIGALESSFFEMVSIILASSVNRHNRCIYFEFEPRKKIDKSCKSYDWEQKCGDCLCNSWYEICNRITYILFLCDLSLWGVGVYDSQNFLFLVYFFIFYFFISPNPCSVKSLLGKLFTASLVFLWPSVWPVSVVVAVNSGSKTITI